MSEINGKVLASELRKTFRIGTRTRRYRAGQDLHSEMLEALRNATVYPGYYVGARHDAFAAAWGVLQAYAKHVEGYRIDGILRAKIVGLSPYRFAALLGEMFDAGVRTTGDGERFFASMR